MLGLKPLVAIQSHQCSLGGDVLAMMRVARIILQHHQGTQQIGRPFGHLRLTQPAQRKARYNKSFL